MAFGLRACDKSTSLYAMRFDLFAVLLLFGGQAGATPITGEGPRRSVS
eukprot:COSAG06_NODE_52771_length_303_cov_144.254902_1_plen_47_part_10